MNETRRGCFDGALGKAPFALRQHFLRRPRVGFRGADLVGARRHLRRRHAGFELLDARVVALELRAGVIEHGAAHEPAREELLLARNVRGRELTHRARLLQLLRHHLDFGGTLAGAQVREARLGTAQALVGFAAGRGLVLVLEREQRLRRRNLIASLDGELLQRAGERRRDADIFPFDVALQRSRRFPAARGKKDERG